MSKDEALRLALAFIARVNRDGWILDSFEPEMYATIAAIKEALAKEWVGLTDEEAKQVWTQLNYDMSHGKFATDDNTRHVIVEFYQAIEAKLKEKNGG